MRSYCFCAAIRANETQLSGRLLRVNQKDSVTFRIVTFGKVPLNGISIYDNELPHAMNERLKHNQLILKSLLKKNSLKVSIG
jgi:hypothetical protein